MKKHILFILFIFLSLIGISQPTNDDCDGIIDLGQAPIEVNNEIYNNVGATPSDIGSDNVPSCFTEAPRRDVWFTFTASDTITEYNIRIVGIVDQEKNIPSIYNPEFSIYRGPECGVDNLFEFACSSSSIQGVPNSVSIDTISLTPGSRYYVRVNDLNVQNAQPGGFKLLVTNLLKPVTIADEGVNNACNGTIYDSGGPDGDYKDNEDFTYTICPKQNAGCIEFNLEYYRFEQNGEDSEIKDQLLFFDGENINAPVIGKIGKAGFENSNEGVVNGGGVNYIVKATSGCLTMQFKSNNELSFPGFKGTWKCLDEGCEPEIPIEITTDITNEQVIENIARPGMEVTIDTIKCSKESYGVFVSESNELGLKNGIVLSTGKAKNAIGPNKGIDFEDGEIGTPGDSDLGAADPDTLFLGGDTIVLGSETFDACVLEVEIFTPTDEISFDYTMGSEEYPEFVSSYNDTYAFLISGEGIEGDPSINNQENLAVLPNSQAIISINSINMNNNWEYYRSNEFFDSQTNTSKSSLEYDGFVVDKFSEKGYLTSTKKVIPCQKYKLKFAIADRGDNWFDSGVFISRISAGNPELGINFSTGLDGFIENCTPSTEYVELSIPGYSNDTVTYNIIVGGTATRDVDYVLGIPFEVTFLPGETKKTFPISVLSDNIVEPKESIEITLSKDYNCGTFSYDVLSIDILDAVAVDIKGSRDTISYCEGTPVHLEASGGDFFRWLPAELFEDNQKNPQDLVLTGNQWVYVEGRTGVCTSLDSIYVEETPFEVNVSGDPIVCPGNTVNLNASSTTDSVEYEWKDSEGNIVSQSSTFSTTPTTNQIYTLVSEPEDGCEAKSTSIEIGVYPEFSVSNMKFIDATGVGVSPESLLSTKTIKVAIDVEPVLEGLAIKWFVNNDLKSTTSTTISELIDLTTYIGSEELEFKAEVTDINGCSQIIKEVVTIENDVNVLIPNIFSPNGDNDNDRFRIVNTGSTSVDILTFKVYNRWGNLVYNNENGAEGWDGKFNGKDAQSDTYIYKISYRSSATLEVVNAVGEVTLLR